MKVRTSSGRSREEGNKAATPTPAQDPGLGGTWEGAALGQGARAQLGSVPPTNCSQTRSVTLALSLYTDVHTTASPPLCSSPVPCQPAEPSPHNPTDPLFIIPCWNSLLASAPTPKKPLSSWVPGGGNPVLRHRCPGPIQTPLLLELALKPMLDIIQVEGTDRRARDAEGARKRCGLGVGRDHTVLPGKTAANFKHHVRGRSLRGRDSPLEAMLGERRSEQQAGFEGSFTPGRGNGPL